MQVNQIKANAHTLSHNSLLDTNFKNVSKYWTHWQKWRCHCTSAASKEQYRRKHDNSSIQWPLGRKDLHVRHLSQQRNSESPARNSINSLKSPRSGLEIKSYDHNSSFEKERQLYESYPNSRSNSRNRAVSANPMFLSRKSPILTQLEHGNYKHRDNENNRPSLKWVIFKTITL